MQEMISEVKEYADNHDMVINKKKTKAILFNQARNYDFLPNISIENEQLEVVEEIRVLGVNLRSDLSRSPNSDNMCNNAFAWLWMLRRLKKLGASDHDLLDVYQKQIRCTVEYAVDAWASNIKQYEVMQLERKQKAALAKIFDQRYRNYAHALKLSGLKSLAERRKGICLKFAKKAFKNPKYQHWFCVNPQIARVKTRSEKPDLKPVKFANSPIAYLTQLLNEDKE
jgi:hypothetical protein